MKKLSGVLLMLVVLFGFSVSSVMARCWRQGKTEYCDDSGRVKVTLHKTTPEEEKVQKKVAEHKAAVAEQEVLKQTAQAIYDYQVDLYNSTQLAAAIKYEAEKKAAEAAAAAAKSAAEKKAAAAKIVALADNREEAVSKAVTELIESGALGTNYTVTDKSGDTYKYSAVNATFSSSDCKAVGCKGGNLVTECGEYDKQEIQSGGSSLCSGNVGIKIWDEADRALCLTIDTTSASCNNLATRNQCIPTQTISLGTACGNGGTMMVNNCAQANCSGSKAVAQSTGGGGGNAPVGCTNFCAYPLCGQDNLCGGSCNNTDGAKPTKVALYPPDGAVLTKRVSGEDDERIEFTVRSSGSSVQRLDSDGIRSIMNSGDNVLGDSDLAGATTVTWGPVAKATYYQVQFYPKGSSCADEEAYCTITQETSYSFVPLSKDYYYRVRPVNDTCLPADWMLDLLNETGDELVSSDQKSIGFRSIYNNNYTSHDGRKNYVITDQQSWQNLWNEIRGYDRAKTHVVVSGAERTTNTDSGARKTKNVSKVSKVESLSAEDIDFENKMLLAVCDGQGGSHIEINSIDSNYHVVVKKVYLKTKAITHSCHVVEVDKSSKGVVFQSESGEVLGVEDELVSDASGNAFFLTLEE